MADSTKSASVFEMLILLEEAAGTFYKLCALKFPANRDFWMSLSAAEEQHARFLRDLGANPAEAVGFAARRRFTAAPLKSLLAALKKHCDAVETTVVTQTWALTTAQSIENSITENKVLSPVPGDPDTMIKTIRRINQETHGHCVQIESALAALKK